MLDKSHIRKIAIELLTYRGCDMWINNNVAVRGRKFLGRKGSSDLLGISKQGLLVACEIKTINDYLFKDQKDFLSNVEQRGGIALIAYENRFGQVEVEEYGKYLIGQMSKK